ncbi:MAG: SCO family protein [Polyangiaceae bacterium]|nr:SCO family protein [Polyangiaceae bacterium]
MSSTTGGPPSLHDRFSALVARPAFWVILIALVLVVPLRRALGGRVPEPPSLRLPLPAFELVNERGEPFGLANLRGKVWVADFVFTTCPTVCPKLTARMGEIQRRAKHLGDAFHLVTFTVDPETDTPEVLAAYARAHRAQPRRWSFLTGKLGDVETTVVKGFKIAMGKEDAGGGIFSIFHGERLVLVDRDGAIRGYYEADDAGVDQLLVDAGTLAVAP